MAGIETTFEELKRHYRTPIIADIGGFRPPDDPRTSWFGAGCSLQNQVISDSQGKPLFPLLQINCEELPRAVPEFTNVKLIVVYLSPETIPFDTVHGDGWAIREYDSLDGLLPVEVEMPEHLKPLPIKWRLGEAERPGWEESWELVDLNPVSDDSSAFEDFFELPHYYKTKIGGFSSDVQHMIPFADEFVFQIASEEKPKWNLIDAGVAYFGKIDGEWKMHIQFS